ncbi:MAG: hypothetical protein ACREL2_08455 [Gemmatimonadales bacterium]
MNAVAQASMTVDHTDVRYLVRGAVKIGLLTATTVFVFSLVSRFTDGTLMTALETVILLAGLSGVVLLPGIWTNPRTVEGIAGAAAIGLGATFIYMMLDVSLLQNIGTYTDRWRAIGGGSNWWWHPVWWMLGTYLCWFGAFAQSNQAVRRGAARPAVVMVLGVAYALLLGVIANLIHFPAAEWSMPTFAVAFIPGLALTVLTTALAPKRV